MLRFFLIFFAALLVLFLGELTPPAQTWLVQPWTNLVASTSAALLHLFDPAVVSQGNVLLDASTGAGVAIEAGCNGVEACLILLAALLAFPARWGAKAIGFVAGFAAIQAANLARIVTLFYLAAWNHAVFEFAHLYLWQALIMLDVLVVWLLWMRWVSRQDFDRAASTA